MTARAASAKRRLTVPPYATIRLVLAAVVAALAWWMLARLGERLPLPTIRHPSDLIDWARQAGAARAAVTVLRSAGVLVAGYLTVLYLVGAVAVAVRSPALLRLADRATAGLVQRVLAGALTGAIGTAAVMAPAGAQDATPGTSAPVMRVLGAQERDLVDVGPRSLGTGDAFAGALSGPDRAAGERRAVADGPTPPPSTTSSGAPAQAATAPALPSAPTMSVVVPALPPADEGQQSAEHAANRGQEPPAMVLVLPEPGRQATGETAVGGPTPGPAARDADRATSGPTTGSPPSLAALPSAIPADAGPPPRSDDAWTVRGGDHLWGIAETVVVAQQGPSATVAEVTRYWMALIDRNRGALADPDNPDLIFVGQVLALPPLGPTTS